MMNIRNIATRPSGKKVHLHLIRDFSFHDYIYSHLMSTLDISNSDCQRTFWYKIMWYGQISYFLFTFKILLSQTTEIL